MVIWVLCDIVTGFLVSRGCSKNVSWPWLFLLGRLGSLTMALTGKYVYMAHHFILLLLNPFTLMLIETNGDLSTLCHSCLFTCQQGVLKLFPGPVYFCSKDGVVWLWHLLVYLCIWLTVTFCYCPNLFDLRVNIELWSVEHSVSQLRVCLS